MEWTEWNLLFTLGFCSVTMKGETNENSENAFIPWY